MKCVAQALRQGIEDFLDALIFLDDVALARYLPLLTPRGGGACAGACGKAPAVDVEPRGSSGVVEKALLLENGGHRIESMEEESHVEAGVAHHLFGERPSGPVQSISGPRLLDHLLELVLRIGIELEHGVEPHLVLLAYRQHRMPH